MKKILSLLSLAALTVGLLGSCSKMNERIDSLEKRVDGIESTKIASVEQQIAAINASINDLKTADVTINGNIEELKTAAQAQQTLIDALKEADQALGQKDDALEESIATLEGRVAVIAGQIVALEEADKAINVRIDELKSYVDTEIGKTKDWAEETFATLAQYQQTADTLAALSVTVNGISITLAGVQTSISGLDTKIGGISTELQGKITSAKTELEGKIDDLKTELEGKIATAISNSETSIKTWINELLEGYYTAAQVDAKITGLNTAIDAANGTRIDSLATELTKLKTAVDTAKAAIRTEYKNAIDVAINKLDGEIRGALKDSVLSVNGRAEALETRVTNLENRVLAVEGNVNKLLAMIQSVSITPAYSDGSVEAVDGILTLKCVVSPAAAIVGMESLKDSLLIYADSVKVKTKATTPAYMTIEVSEASVLDAAQGAITLKADISEYLPKGADKALTVALKIKNGISDFTTEFVPVYVAPKTFKAVYDTNGGANTLTFYYDAVDHSGNGKTVYDNLPTAANNDAAWGYNGVRKEIKKVVITESVKEYSSLTSTACMFHDMTIASSIEGAEYLDVSKVTNMMAMFWNFGSNSSTLSSVPDVKDWNTESVTNMQNMFTSYGKGSNGLNAVPDVGKWNTASVTNMNSMFESYGESSNNLNKVPDVSKWNTDRVTNMGDMFLKYGYTSTALNTVPDVSGWNTIEVTTMTNMFQNYGYSSTALSTVPNVSNWKTGNVTIISNLFKDYGKASVDIDCTLDLSGWDLKNVTSGGDAFTFAPKTFNVTIPAKTGDKANEVGNWYFGDGTDYIVPPTGKTFTPALAGALSGEFSVSGTKKVHFSQGNLVATIDNSGTPTAWKFAANQYDYIGKGGANKTIGTSAGDIDFFGWSTASTTYGISTSTSSSSYSGDFVDWGKAYCANNSITPDNTWRTQNTAEWRYLFNTRTASTVNGTANARYAKATVNNITGIILLPDTYAHPEGVTLLTSINTKGAAYTANTYDLTNWGKMESAGAVFLPAGGGRDGSNVNYVGDRGCYWSSTALYSDYAYFVRFYSSDVFPGYSGDRYGGFSVRLVTEVPAAGDPGNGTEQYKNNSNPDWFS